jgi:phage protein D
VPTEDQALISGRPRFRVDGQDRPNLGEAVQSAQVRLPLSGQASAEVRLLNWGTDANSGEAAFQFNDLRLGATLEILLGEQAEQPDFSGDVTAIEERYGDGAPQLVLLAEDRLHRLAKVRHSRVFEDLSLGDLASELASDAGLDCDANASTSGTWHQVAESDLAFLLRLAQPFDLNPRLEDGRLRLKPEEADRNPRTLTLARDILTLRLIADLNGQPTAVRALGHNLDNDEDIDARTDALEPAPGGTTAANLLGTLGWGDERLHIGALNQTQAEAEARGGFRARARRFVHGELSCSGVPGLRSGREVELTGISPRLAGRYLVVDCTHRFDSTQGFRTRLKLNRADWHD